MSDDERVQAVLDELDPTPAHEANWPVSRRQTLRALASVGALAAVPGASAQSAGTVIADAATFSNYGSASTASGYDLTIEGDTFSFDGDDTIGLEDGGTGTTVVTPSGASAQEVIGPDGSTLWVPAIPDSVVNRWPIDEGSGSTIADEVGDADGTINGATWVSGAWIGDYALEGDGTDDYVDLPVESFGSTLGGESGIAFTLQTTNQDFDDYFGVQNTNDDAAFRSFTTDTGQIAYVVKDSSGNSIQVRTDGGVNYSDGNKHRAVLQKSGDSASDFEIAVDGSIVTTTIVTDTGPLGTFTDFEYPLTLFGRRYRADSVGPHTDAIIDQPTLLDSVWDSAQIQDDYDTQPWS